MPILGPGSGIVRGERRVHAIFTGQVVDATHDEALIETALHMALLGRQPTADLLFHSDRGSQLISDDYRAALAGPDISVSMSRAGNCYDNAVTESFFGTLKGECVERSCFQTRREARQAILSMWNASTIGFDGTRHWVMSVWLPMSK